MTEFEQDFFEDEIRDGFFVSSDMKRIWAAGIEVLMEIDRICKKHDITYFADFGTLLGAVRHNGYIPWDDDLDIVMLRDGYMKFIAVAKKELTFPMICADIYHTNQWNQPFARVTNGKGISLNQCFLDRFHGCPYTAGVDIFVLDNMPESEDEFYLIAGLYSLMGLVSEGLKKKEKGKKGAHVEGKTGDANRDEEIEDALCKIEEICNVRIERERDIYYQLLRLIDGLGAMNAGNKSEELFDISFISNANYFYAGYKSEWYSKSIDFPFENITIPVPIGFDKILRQEFGNYLRPVKEFNHTLYDELEREMKMALRDVRGINDRIERLKGIL